MKGHTMMTAEMKTVWELHTPKHNLGGRVAYSGEHGDWGFVVAQSRDSDNLAKSNFRTALAELYNGESEDVVIERSQHWSCGWFEYIAVRPGTNAYGKALEILERLSQYPVLDDSDLWELEQEQSKEVWENCYDLEERKRFIRERADTTYGECSFGNFRAALRGDFSALCKFADDTSELAE